MTVCGHYTGLVISPCFRKRAKTLCWHAEPTMVALPVVIELLPFIELAGRASLDLLMDSINQG